MSSVRTIVDSSAFKNMILADTCLIVLVRKESTEKTLTKMIDDVAYNDIGSPLITTVKEYATTETCNWTM